MAKGIYVGVEQDYRIIAEDIIPKEWTFVSNEEYVAIDGTVIVADEFSCNTGVRALDKVVDGDTTTWCAASSTTKNASLTLTFPDKRKITKMKTYITVNNTSYFKKMVIQGSNDNSSWVDLYETTTAQTGLTEFSLNNTDYYQYYKLNLTLSGFDYLRLYEWQTSEYIVEESVNVEVAHKVKKVYVGVDGVARKVKKGYIGVDGVARQFYSSETLIPFTTCPYIAPAESWEQVEANTEYTYTNQYGTWRVRADATYSSSYPVRFAVDNNSSSSWQSGYSTGGYCWFEFYCPQGVTINPKTIYIAGTDNNNSGSLTLVLYKADGTKVSRDFSQNNGYDFSGTFANTLNLQENEFFSSFRFRCKSNVFFLSDFHIAEGVIKTE